MGPGGVALACWRVAIGVFLGGRPGRRRSRAVCTAFAHSAARPLLVVFLLFLLLRAASLPIDGDVERNPGPADAGVTAPDRRDAGLAVTGRSPDVQGRLLPGQSRALAPASSPTRPRVARSVCPECEASFHNGCAMWRHINLEHIARRVFPSVAFLTQHDRRLCSEPTCSFAYSTRFSTCQRSLGHGRGRCSGLLLDDPTAIIAARRLPSPPLQTAQNIAGSGLAGPPDLAPSPPAPLPDPPGPPPTPAPVYLPGPPEDLALAAVTAAAQRFTPATSNDLAAFRAIMEEIVLLPVGTVAHVPRAARPLLAQVLTGCLRDARSGGLWGFVRLMMVAKAVLRTPPRGGRRKRAVVKTSIIDRLQRWTQDDLVSLWKEARAAAQPRQLSFGAEALAKDNAHRALRFAADGRYSDAMRALRSLGCASPDDIQAQQEMMDRHPPHALPEWSDDTPPPLAVDSQFVATSLRGFPRGSSPGATKLRAQHLQDAIQGTTVPAALECLGELTRYVNHLLSGQADRRVAPWLVGAPLTALHKASGGLRPIAVGEVLRRLVSRIACSSIKADLPALFLPSGQVGVGVPGGLEAAVHSLRATLTERGTDGDLCCLKLDMHNAFNECHRDVFLQRARQDLPELFSWVQWCYTAGGELRFGHHRIQSTAGVQQGDPLGPVLFSLVLLSLLDAIGPVAGIDLHLWYLDDGTLVGSRAAIRLFLDRLLTIGPQFGLYANLDKCELYWPSGVANDFTMFPHQIRRVFDQHGIELLGSPVFGSRAFFDTAISRRVSKVLDAQAHLPDLDHPQVALHLLRSCTSICKVNHLLRTVPPEYGDSQWERFDLGLRHALSQIIKTSVPDSVWLQATLPPRLGGLGLRETRLAHAAAFLGSCAQVRELCGRLLTPSVASTDVGCAANTASPAQLELMPGEQGACGVFRDLLSDTPVINIDLAASSQRRLQALLDSAAHTSLRARSGLRDQARLTATAAPHAGAWLRALPAPALGLAMAPHEFVLALRLWLGIAVFAATRVRCVCGTLLDPFGDHLLGCGHGVLRIRRHDALRDVVYHALRLDCPGVRTEQRCAGDHHDRPGDIFHPDFQDGLPGYFDVTVRNTLQAGFVAEGASHAGVAAAAGEAAKDMHHADAVHQAGGVFFPLVVETFGVWTPSSLELLRRVAARTTTASGLAASRATNNLLQQLSVRLWQFNARMLRSRMLLVDDAIGWELPG